MPPTSPAYDELLLNLRRAAVLDSVGNLLGWDQETMMPARTAPFRAEQLALIGREAHEARTAPHVGELLATCEADAALIADDATAANLREIRRDFDRARKLPADLVAEISEVSSHALEAWKIARAESDFAKFRPWLERQFELARRKAACYGAADGDEAYDALLDDYEPGMTAQRIEATFTPLRAELTPLIAEIAASAHAPSDGFHRLELPLAAQRAFNREVVERLGFDFGAGRFDESVHPFSSGVAPGDTRITTRYGAAGFADALGSTMHETGHALYEQGLPRDAHFGQPLGESLGLGVHESQSRLWENHVGRSRAFWRWATPLAQRAFGAALAPFGADDLWHAVNRVQPHLIRVESDEATYNLHIMLRFDLERAMLRGDLAVADLPAAWNERIERDLALEVPDDRRGCLQDIHWGMGAIGYFPTYTLGTLYAAQLWEAIARERPEIEASIAAGDFAPLLAWLREKIHGHGRRWPADELCLRLTGAPLTHAPLMRHLRGKLGEIYRLGAK